MTVGKGSFAALAMAAIFLSGAAPAMPNAPAFADRFKKLDQTRWLVSDGWRNGDYTANDWRASQVKTGAGLTLTLKRRGSGPNDYSSGEVQSREVFGYGYFEAKMKAAPGSGIVTGFFTYIGPQQGKTWNEIDVEVIGKQPRQVMLTYINGTERRSKTVDLPFDATQEEHLYGFDWRPNGIRWYLDGKLIAEQLGADVPIPNEPQKIMVDLWASRTLTSWLGPFPRRAPTASAHIACISYSPERPARSACN